MRDVSFVQAGCKISGASESFEAVLEERCNGSEVRVGLGLSLLGITASMAVGGRTAD